MPSYTSALLSWGTVAERFNATRDGASESTVIAIVACLRSGCCHYRAPAALDVEALSAFGLSFLAFLPKAKQTVRTSETGLKVGWDV